MRDNNILCRHIKPAGRKLGIPWVNWRCLRTSYATWLKKAGGHVRDAQSLMRHSKASTTLDIYMQGSAPGALRISAHTYWDQIRTSTVCKSLKRWWPGTESNRRRQPFQGCALPTELPGQYGWVTYVQLRWDTVKTLCVRNVIDYNNDVGFTQTGLPGQCCHAL